MRITTYCLLLLLFVATNACRKKEDNNAVPIASGGPYCLMTAIIEDHNTCSDSTTLVLNGGKLTTAVFHSDCTGQQTSAAQSFIYEAGRVYHIDTTTLQDRDTFFVDSNLRILEYHPSKGQPEPLVKYFYTTQGVLETSVEYYGGNAVDTTRYVFSNGDLIEWHNSRYDTRYTYYDTLPVPGSGLLTQQALSYGSVGFLKSRHLVKEFIQNNTLACSFAYEFDGYGNVSRKRMTIPITATVYTTRYKYACMIE